MKKKKNIFKEIESEAQRLKADPAAKGVAQNVIDYIQAHQHD